MAYIKRKHDNEKGWYGSLSPRWVPSIPSLCIYTDGKLFNYLYSLGKRELIGNIYPLDSGQINILYCYITLTSLPTLTNRYPPHRPLLPDQRTSQPEAPPGVMCHTQLCPLQGVAAPPTPFPSTLFSIYPPPPGENQKLILINWPAILDSEALMLGWPCLSLRAHVSLCLALHPPESC